MKQEVAMLIRVVIPQFDLPIPMPSGAKPPAKPVPNS